MASVLNESKTDAILLSLEYLLYLCFLQPNILNRLIVVLVLSIAITEKQQ